QTGRAWIRRASDGETAHSPEAIVNSTIPVVNTRRRPKRSANLPAATSKAAKTMLQELRTQEGETTELPGKERRMLGKATLTIVASRNASSAPNDATSSAPVLLTRRSPRSVACGCDALAVHIDRTQPGERRAEARKGLFDRGLSRSDEAAPFSEVTQLAGGKRAE